MEINTVGITGIVVSQPEKRNNLYGRLGIYRLWVDVERDSGTIDRILVLLQEGETETEETVTTTLYPVEYWQQPEVIIEKKAGKLTAEEIIKGFQPGSTVEVTGRVQTYKDKETGRTQLFVWGLYLAAVRMQVKQIQIKAKATPHNAKQVAEAMAALGDLIRQFKEINTQEGIDEHVARINGYAYALVNMDVIAEETANTQVAYAACAAAAARREELERLKGKWQ